MSVNYEELAEEWMRAFFFEPPEFIDVAEYVTEDLDVAGVSVHKLYQAIADNIDTTFQRWEEVDR